MYKLLIVDDEVLICKGLSNIIQWGQIGFELVGAVQNAQTALNLYDISGIDVLLTDISMPEMNGLDLIRIAREKNPRLKTIVISGYSEFDYAIEAIKLKVETYMLKPLDPNKIIEIFKKLKDTMDMEREHEWKEDFLQSVYNLMRMLHSDINIMKDLSRDYSDTKQYQLVLLYLTPKEKMSWDEKKENYFKHEIEAKINGCFYRNAENLFAMIMVSSQTGELVKRLDNYLDSNQGVGFRMAVSAEVSSLSDLTEIYLSVANQLRHTPEGMIISCEEENSSKCRQYLDISFTNLLRAMEEGAYARIDDIVNNLFDNIKKNKIVNPIEYCKKLLRNIVLYFRIENGPRINLSLIENEGMEQEIMELDVVKKYFSSCLESLITQLRENSDSMTTMVSYQARQYVNEHYEDKELTLKSVAKALDISYSYLSTAFAKTFEENFKTYVVGVRMEKARELLMTRQHKIYEIADQVGYSSSRYFTDAFKRYYGIAPVDYLSRIHHGLS